MTSHLTPLDEGPVRQPEVMLVDDDKVNLQLTSLALRDRGFRVTEVGSGEAALELLAEWTPDLIVLDAKMPGLDGFATCRAVRSLAGFENVPVLMLTGLDDDASVQRAYHAGATDFFVKATQWGLLEQRLRFLLRDSRTRLELERSKAKLARAQDLARMGSFDWYRSEGRLVISSEGLRVLGLAPAERVTLRRLLRMVPGDERRRLLRILRGVVRHGAPLASDVPVTVFGSSRRILHLEAEPEFDEHGRHVGYTGIVQDVTDRRTAEDRIKHLANFDSLTQLPNRRQLIWRAEMALEHARRLQHPFALLLIDLDNFKKINDGYGHAEGDQVLVEVARRLRACVRHSDQITEGAIESAGTRSHRALEAVGRLGGDEFVALLPEISDERDAERVSQRILDVMRAPLQVDGQDVFVTASVGVALYPRDGQTVPDLLRNSDVAMYSVKAQGKNAAAVFGPQLAGGGREKLELETALHKAIEREELVLFYQPKVDVRAHRMVGVEALMRWRRGGKLVSPGDFIPLAEETGLILPMSEWALREAARQSREWQLGFGFDDAIAVNLPGRLFRRTDLVEQIRASAVAHGVPQRLISLEITEEEMMKDLQSVIPCLHSLNQIGVEVAIDDFGKGYSSLAYLTTLPISELKIDIDFVRDLGRRPQCEAVVRLIIEMARTLGHRVIAEGVEKPEQMEHLYRLGCGIMQGYLFGRPMPADELVRWHEHTVLARRAPWIGRLGGADFGAGAARSGAHRVH
jgi:predicted signal transduction protein with EAL and GGDEF domain/CheY-like chemotaxis protein